MGENLRIGSANKHQAIAGMLIPVPEAVNRGGIASLPGGELLSAGGFRIPCLLAAEPAAVLP